MLFLCLGTFAIDPGIAFNKAAAHYGNLIAPGVLDGYEIPQVPDLHPDPTPLLIAGQSDYCPNPTKRRSRLKRSQKSCQWQQFRVTPPMTGSFLSPSTEKKTVPVTQTTPWTQTEDPVLNIETPMKLSDEEKCFQYQTMKTPVCCPGFPVFESPAITVAPVHGCKLLFPSPLTDMRNT